MGLGSKIRDAWGDDAPMMGGGSRITGVLPTGVDSLDVAIGLGGYPEGRFVFLAGKEGCLAADTRISFSTIRPDGARANAKGGTIEQLYLRFHGLSRYRGRPDLFVKDASFTVSSVNEENRVFHQRVADVLLSGEQECFEVVTAGGCRIEATAGHPFYDGTKYQCLRDLRVGDSVMVHTNVRFRKGDDERAVRGRRGYLYVKHHATAPVKVITDKARGYEYTYRRLIRARAVVEAHLNGLTLDKYIERLNSGDIDDLETLDANLQVHHIDEDVTNDSIENLVVMSCAEHSAQHALENHNNLRFMAVPDTIVAIGPVGVRQTYDLKVEGPHHNFVADHFVVHNSGKTNLALLAAKKVQERGGGVLFFDFEQKLNGAWAESLGVDLDDMLLEFPDTIEKGFDIATEFAQQAREIDKDVPVLIVWDSLHMAEAAKSARGEITAGNFGNESQAYARGFRRVAKAMREKKVIFIAISQMRLTIDAMGNSRDKVGVGKASVHVATLIVDVKSKPVSKTSTDGYFEVTGKIIKNQAGQTRGDAKWDFVPGHGVHIPSALLNAALMTGVAKGPMPGGWYEFTVGKKPEKVRGANGLEKKGEAFMEAVRAVVHKAAGITR